MGDWILDADGDAGDSGRRKGEVRGEPKESGDGLYEDGIACLEGAVSFCDSLPSRSVADVGKCGY